MPDNHRNLWPTPGGNVSGGPFLATPAERRPPMVVKMQGIAEFRENSAKRPLNTSGD
jgi:hypothetical protein